MAIAGPGIGLPYPYSPYPPTIPGVSSSVWSNKFFLPRATVWIIPPGRWGIFTGSHSYVQILDPVTNTWTPVVASQSYIEVNSDGTNYRLANLSGTPLSRATITAAGTGYVAALTTVTAGSGGSTWTTLVDGNVASVTVGNDKNGVAGGTNFTLVPLVIVQAPPPGGIQATALAVLSAGAIASVTVEDAGAGYTSAPGLLVIPNPADPNIGSITIPALTAVLGTAGTGAITGILQTYQGTSVASTTLTIGGGGSGASGTATATVALVASAADDTVFVQWLPSGV
jgi:hypothetical protein